MYIRTIEQMNELGDTKLIQLINEHQDKIIEYKTREDGLLKTIEMLKELIESGLER